MASVAGSVAPSQRAPHGMIGALLRLPVRALDVYATISARRNAWSALQADRRRARERAEVQHFLDAARR